MNAIRMNTYVQKETHTCIRYTPLQNQSGLLQNHGFSKSLMRKIEGKKIFADPFEISAYVFIQLVQECIFYV